MPVNNKKFLIGWFGRLFPVIILTVIVGWLFLANYQPGTWLSGWDTLHPEFNFSLYWERVFYGAWQEHQGLGAPAAQGHASEIPRVIILFLMSLFLPDSILRYVFMFLCLWVGVLGLYVFSHRLVGTGRGFKSRLVATVSALIYLLNLTVVQQFYVPLEMFAVHYAALPWLSYFLIRYWKNGRIKSLLGLLIVSILGAPMAHTSTLWYVMFGGFGLVGICWIILNKFRFQAIKRVVLGLTLLLATNLFWILPNLYYIINHSQVVSESTIHSTFSEEAFLQGRVYGRWNDVLLQKNFLFNWRVYDFNQEQFVDLLQVWDEHFNNQLLVQLVAYSVWLIALVGFVVGIRRRQKEVLVFTPMLLMAVFFWINANPPLTDLFILLRDNISLFREGLRFPFTKFSIMLIFSLSVLFGLGLDLFANRLKTKKTLIVAAVIYCLALVGLAWPMFQGHLISPTMKVQFPSEYFEIFDWFETQPRQTRVAKLPLHTYWGWNYYDWGYQGAGFTWFGIPQPTLDREFDRWGKHNEGFYNELSFAVYGMDWELVDKVLNKYQVQYLFLDESVINPGGTSEVLFNEELKEYFASSQKYDLVKQANFLSVYKFELDNTEWVWSVDNPKIIDADLTYVNYDPVYDVYGNYVIMAGGNLLPFVNFDTRSDLEIEFGEEQVTVTKYFDNPRYVESLVLPDYMANERTLPLDISIKPTASNQIEMKLELRQPYFLINDQKTVFGKSIWVTEQLPYNLNQLKFVRIGDTAIDLSVVADDTSDFVKVGSTIVDSQSPVEIAFYSNQPEIRNDIVASLSNRAPRLCANPDQKFLLPNVEVGELKLEVEDQSVCLGDIFELDSNSLFEISFETSSQEGLFPWFCVSGVGQNGCINDVFPQAVYQTQDRRFEYLLPVPEGRFWFDFVAQAIDDNAQGSISFRQLNVASYEELDGYSLNVGQLFSSFAKAEEVEINSEVKHISARVPVSNVVAEDFALGRGNYKPVNCDISEQGSVTKKKMFLGSLMYEAFDGGVSCDFFDYNKVPYNQSYLIRVKGYNLEGQGLKFYLRNQTTGKTDIEKIINKPEFDQAFAVYAKQFEGEGYTINLETKSYERFISRNQVSDLSLLPVPLKWLSGIEISRSTQDSISGDLQIEGVAKFGFSKYILQITGDRGIISLDQGFDPGWQGFVINNDNWINRTLPWFSGDKLEHVKVNGWANGWIIDGDKQLSSAPSFVKTTEDTVEVMASEASDERMTVVIVYWPQYLQWGGFGLLFLTLVGLGTSVYWPTRGKQ